MEFDDEGLKWAIIREAEIKDVTANPNYLLIADCLKKEIKGPKEISSETQINVATVKTCLTRMMAKDILVKVSKGKYGVIGVDYDNIEPGGPREKWNFETRNMQMPENTKEKKFQSLELR